MFPPQPRVDAGKRADKKKMPAGGAAGTNGHAEPSRYTDDEIVVKLSRAKNSAKFSRLMDGDISGHGDDASRADAALCSLIAFYTDDKEQIERIFNRSQLATREEVDGQAGLSRADDPHGTRARPERYAPRRPEIRFSRNGTKSSANGDGHNGESEPRVEPQLFTIGALTIRPGPARRTPAGVVKAPIGVLKEGALVADFVLSSTPSGWKGPARLLSQLLEEESPGKVIDKTEIISLFRRIIADASRRADEPVVVDGPTVESIVKQQAPAMWQLKARTDGALVRSQARRSVAVGIHEPCPGGVGRGMRQGRRRAETGERDAGPTRPGSSNTDGVASRLVKPFADVADPSRRRTWARTRPPAAGSKSKWSASGRRRRRGRYPKRRTARRRIGSAPPRRASLAASSRKRRSGNAWAAGLPPRIVAADTSGAVELVARRRSGERDCRLSGDALGLGSRRPAGIDGRYRSEVLEPFGAAIRGFRLRPGRLRQPIGRRGAVGRTVTGPNHRVACRAGRRGGTSGKRCSVTIGHVTEQNYLPPLRGPNMKKNFPTRTRVTERREFSVTRTRVRKIFFYPAPER